MRARSRVRFLASAIASACLIALGACSAGAPSASPGGTGSPTPTAATSPVEPTATSVATPSPGAAQASLPIRGSASDIGARILMVPGPDGSLYLSIPRSGGSVLTLLDEGGRTRPGWPVVATGSTSCSDLLAADDGSVRAVCDTADLPPPELDAADVRAFAFDSGGRLMAGWPIELRPGYEARVVGDELMILSIGYLEDVVEPGMVSHEAWLQAVAADGTIRTGRRVPMLETCCGESWAIGPNGVAYGRIPVEPGADPGAPQATQLTAVDLDGVVAGWPLRIDGAVSEPAFDRNGEIHVTVSSYDEAISSHVAVITTQGRSVAKISNQVPIATAIWGELDGEHLTRPLIGVDGTAFVYSAYVDATVYAIHAPDGDGPPSGDAMAGWPYRPPQPLARLGHCQDVDCVDPVAVPALGPGNVLYLPLLAASESVGGTLVALGSDGRVRPGWPVELKRPGSDFWSVVAGPDGTIYALAIEPESTDASSATILVIAPDSTVLYSTTVVEP